MLNMAKLKNQLRYDPLTGIFKWKDSGSGRRKNLIAGCVKKKGDNTWRRIVFDGDEYTSGQMAWALMRGALPEFVIDHIDGDPLNDKWANLRRGDGSVDQRNCRKSFRNKTGVVGVRLMGDGKTYHAFIGIGGRVQKYLGSSVDFFEAVCMRKSAERKYGYSDRHGS